MSTVQIEKVAVVISKFFVKNVVYHLSIEGTLYTVEEQYKNDLYLGILVRDQHSIIVTDSKLCSHLIMQVQESKK